ncbi:MAG: ATP synthase F1 subunit delta [Candidatus Brocadiae bacterium]|nr:ATP synthase F1 subunit delta [Candidatus Brocadiia bacterium]
MKLTRSGNPRYYAYALYELSSLKKQQEEFLENFELVLEVQKQKPELNFLAQSPLISNKKKFQFFDRILHNHLNPLFLNFIKVLVKKQQLHLLEKIYVVYRHFCDEWAESIRATVTSAVPLTEEEQKRICNVVSGYLQKSVFLRVIVDPDILGGITLQAGDIWMDASLRGKMKSFQKNLQETARKVIKNISLGAKNLD